MDKTYGLSDDTRKKQLGFNFFFYGGCFGHLHSSQNTMQKDRDSDLGPTVQYATTQPTFASSLERPTPGTWTEVPPWAPYGRMEPEVVDTPNPAPVGGRPR